MSHTSEPHTIAAARIALAGRQAEYRAACDEAERLRHARDRAIVDLSELGVPTAEIARMLGLSPGRASQLLSAARKQQP